ncbi:extracellular solute-binding protein [Cohnella sp. JJ-181]|uniref:extracellular solute-binding protein n=1 Tax=Cohnella rhizoplanae TaxID=2974897 RepID=UPI0022FFAFD7|nr:extracellular solute-binding protein [Cohnella sp. JJ-181]CAI6059972.1 hypothetical protein COHCIP112018_01835 [Cohnella sp. JJ-181]
MKRYPKAWSGILGSMLAVSVIAGCSGGNNQPSAAASGESGPQPSATASAQASGQASASASTSTEPQPNDRTKFEPPVTITGAIALKASDKLRNGDTPENNPVSRWFKDNLGIVTKYQWVVTDQADALGTKVRLAMTSGEQLPDVLAASGTLFEDLVASGKIQPIDEAFDKYATARVKEAYAKNPQVMATVMRNGKMYGLPDLSNGFVGDTVMWVRQDWLDKLSLKAPTNVEEYEAVLDAFTNGDPDGNGKKDTYGMALGGNTGYHHPTANYMADAMFLFGQHQPYFWLKGEDGQLHYGSVDPVVKDGLVKLSEWSSKGYLSTDFGTQDATKAIADFTSGKAGVVFAPGWAGGWPIGTAIADAEKKNEKLSIKPYPIPSGVDGKVGRQASPPTYTAYVFRDGFEHLDAVFKYWDTLYGCSLEDEMCPFGAGKGEGYDYVMKDGKPDWTVPEGTIDLGRYMLMSPGTTPPNVMEGPNIYQRVAAGSRNNIFEQKLAASNGPLTVEGFATAFQQQSSDVPNGFLGANTKTMIEKWEQLSTLEEQAFLQIIYGKAKPDYFDAFVKQWNDQGGAKITAEVNEQVAVSK